MLRIGLTVSLLLHAAIIAWAVVELRSTRALEAPEVVPISIELLDVTQDKQDLRKGSLKADNKPTKKIEEKPKSVAKPEVKKEKVAALPPPKAEPKKAEPKEEPKKAEDPPKEEAKKVEPKKEEPKAVEPAKPEIDPLAELIEKDEAEQAAPPKKAEEKPVEKKPEAKKAEPKKEQKVAEKAEKKPGKSKEKFDADQLSLLLNKIPNASAKSSDETDAVEEAEIEQKTIGGAKSKGQQLSVIEKNAWISQIRAKLNDCWSPPAGGIGAENIAVPLRFELKPDGRIVGQPRVVSSSGDPMLRIASEAAMRALFQCEPYDMFPPDKYDLWKSWVLNFRPEVGVP